MKELLKKELNKFSLEPSLIDNFIESVSEGLNQNGIEIWINTIKSFSNSQTSRIIIKNICIIKFANFKLTTVSKSIF